MTRVWRPGAGVLGLAFGLTLTGGAAAAEDPAASLLGQPAPSFRLKEVLGDREFALDDFRGRFIVLHFGASW